MNIKGKRRITAKCYFNDNTLYLLQIYERTCFKCWLNVGITSDKAFAEKWKAQQWLTEREYRARHKCNAPTQP